MDKFKIHFELQELEKIMPFGEKPNLRLHWFGLTDGLLWIDAGGKMIYEYTLEAQNYFSNNTRYNDYQLSRFLEDFFGIFESVSESVPADLYQNVEAFILKADKWKESHYDDEDMLFDLFFDEKYLPLTEWYHVRTFDSGHLVGGPYIGCFRYHDKIKIVWKSSYILESGNSIWTSPSGMLEMDYEEFVLSVGNFLDNFFIAMDKQVEKSVTRDLGEVFIDKKRLVVENDERKEGFYKQLAYLKNNPEITDWKKITTLYQEIKGDLQG